MQDHYKVIIGHDGKRRLIVQAYEPVGKQRQAKKRDIRQAMVALQERSHDFEEYLIENLREDVAK